MKHQLLDAISNQIEAGNTGVMIVGVLLALIVVWTALELR